MAGDRHLGDHVEIITDSFTSLGAPRGSIGVIAGDWADGSNDVEISDPATGEVVARVRAAEGEIRPYSGPFMVKEPREHGVLLGRGDELGGDVEEPPMPEWGPILIPGYGTAPIAFSEPPREDIELTGEIPWELRDKPASGPIFH
jgi:hypothetical protein